MDWIFRITLAAALILTFKLWWPRIRRLSLAIRSHRVGESVIGLLIVGFITFVVMQWVPFGWRHTNPPTTGEPVWDSQATHDLVVRACYDCHSNETKWSVYAYVAPGSWLAVSDVEGGRSAMNFSTWNPAALNRNARSAARVVEEGSMPPLQFRLLHPEGRLSDEEKAQLAQGLRNSIGAR